MNSLALRALLPALRDLRGLRVTGVEAPDAWEFRVLLEDRAELVVSLHPEHNTVFPRPPAGEGGEPRKFARNLGDALTGMRLAGADTHGLDRVLALVFEGRDRLGDPRHRQLVLELTGKGANALVLDGSEPFQGKLLERMRTDRSAGARERLETGSPYRPPRSGRADLLRDGADALRAAVTAWQEESGSTAVPPVAELWEGLGPDGLRYLRREASGTGLDEVVATWERIVTETAPGGALHRPTVVVDASGRAEAFAHVAVTSQSKEIRAGLETRRFDTMAEALADAHHHFRVTHRSGSNAALSHALRRAIRRVEKARDAVGRQEGRDRPDADDLRTRGEALLAYAHEVEKGAKEARVPDPRDGAELVIRLNPALDAAENAELYFKKARKAGRSGGAIDTRAKELGTQLRGLTALAERLRDLEDRPADTAWLEEAKRLGVPLPREAAEQVQTTPEDGLPASVRPRQFDLGNGWECLVGKSDRSNHVLTFELARPHDTWMHAESVPGSHVVLRHHEKGKEPPRDVLLTAAAIAAFYSKSRNSGKVPVTVAEKRHVRRPRKAPLGQALVGDHRTLIVVPLDPEGRSRR